MNVSLQDSGSERTVSKPPDMSVIKENIPGSSITHEQLLKASIYIAEIH